MAREGALYSNGSSINTWLTFNERAFNFNINHFKKLIELKNQPSKQRFFILFNPGTTTRNLLHNSRNNHRTISTLFFGVTYITFILQPGVDWIFYYYFLFVHGSLHFTLQNKNDTLRLKQTEKTYHCFTKQTLYLFTIFLEYVPGGRFIRTRKEVKYSYIYIYIGVWFIVRIFK